MSIMGMILSFPESISSILTPRLLRAKARFAKRSQPGRLGTDFDRDRINSEFSTGADLSKEEFKSRLYTFALAYEYGGNDDNRESIRNAILNWA